MNSTTFQLGMATVTLDGQPAAHVPNELVERYEAVIGGQRMSWTEHLHLTAPPGFGRTGRGLSQRAPRHRQLHAAGGA